MMTYFVSRTLDDGLPAGDFNGMNKKARRLYDCGHVQKIEVTNSCSRMWVRADCFPEMKKNIYRICMSTCDKSYNIQTAVCGCKAGKGRTASMLEHYAMLLLSFASLGSCLIF